MAQLVKHPILDFGSDRALLVVDGAPSQALLSSEPARDLSRAISLSAPPALRLLSLKSKQPKKILVKNKNHLFLASDIASVAPTPPGRKCSRSVQWR